MFGYKEFASLNRWVLNWDLKVVMESHCLMCWGRAFQSLGAEKLKARAPMVLRLEVGMVSSPAEGGGVGIHRGGRRGNWRLDCGELYRCGEGKVLIVDAVLYREPMMLDEVIDGGGCGQLIWCR